MGVKFKRDIEFSLRDIIGIVTVVVAVIGGYAHFESALDSRFTDLANIQSKTNEKLSAVVARVDDLTTLVDAKLLNITEMPPSNMSYAMPKSYTVSDPPKPTKVSKR